ncbi:MAG: cytochrome c [Geminicoccaceae bacterium]|jgi:cytochrome c556|nr:cytochrome c [Geminicoccaceae bacterium]MCB9966538.1 cytochrome c [Geminicoccaceae bacterium]
MSPRLIAAIAALGITAIAGFASADPIETRQTIMKSMGAAGKVSGEMIKGNLPFNQDVANLALATFAAASLSYREFFPEGSQAGHDTRAKDTIWTDRAGFIAANEKFAEAATAAVAAKPADLDAFKAAFAPIGENCQSCHETYRTPSS